VDASQISLLLEMVTSMDMAIDRDKLETSMMEIVKILLEHIDDTTYEKDQPLQVGGVTGTYDAYTITLGSESAKAMVVDILTFVRDDATLYNLIGRMMSISEGGSDEPVDMARYQSEIDHRLCGQRRQHRRTHVPGGERGRIRTARDRVRAPLGRTG